ncbi:NAD-dependent deacetylase [Pseudomonas helmanticensis]|uniref:NAD-dependent protein deacylase n=1 Tax=Pseudomonas helmanticensis TaxID=1471381 RepID=A0A4R7VE44_9PSED|nr:NAD-dependent deacylase [Pseudomonas helmanticensis]TDV47463.1 NAD-dependent deacetylase [Pseudomonas helmanticensis]
MTSTVEAVASLVGGAQRFVVFSGAGISAESGIPTFRDPMTGLWALQDPEKLETANAFREDAALVWGWYLWRRAQVAHAQPNVAHQAIAQLGRTREVAVITQNIDDLHERAGAEQVVHLHGSLAQPKCFACHRTPSAFAFEEPVAIEGLRIEPPRCPRCNGKLRPGVVWFGEQLPAAEWKRAVLAAKDCDVLLSIGTSGVVFPAAEIPTIALRAGAYIVHINPVQVAQPSSRELCLVGRATEIVPALVSLIGLPSDDQVERPVR